MKKSIFISISVLLAAIIALGSVAALYASEIIFLKFPVLKGDFISDYMEIPYEKYIDYDQQLPESEIYNIKDYGAIGNGKMINTSSIQNAVDSCFNNGGGIVLIEGGDFLSGNIKLKSNITLAIAENATLVASTNVKDYPSSHFIYTDPLDYCENISIVGPGKIYGNGEYFWNLPKKRMPSEAPSEWILEDMVSDHFRTKRYGRKNRPKHVISLKNVTNLVVENIVMENMWGWTLYAEGSNNVKINNIIINNNLFGENTDGLAFTNCVDVLVEDCFIATGDDGICYKADLMNDGTTNQKLENYIFRNLEICSMTNGIKLGTTSGNDVTNMTIENCRLFNPVGWIGTIAGIAIESVDGSKVDGFTINNIIMENQACPIFVRLGNRNRYNIKDYQGEIKNIDISNIVATGVQLPITLSGV